MELNSTTTAATRRTYGVLTLVLLGGLAGGIGTGSALGPTLAVLTSIALALHILKQRTPRTLPPLVVVAAIGMGCLSPYLWGTAYWTAACLVCVGGTVLYLATELRPTLTRILLPLYVLGAGAALMIAMPDATIDVWFLHQQAGETLEVGGNPWTDLFVRNGAPNPVQETITGYPYPPIVLGTYAVVGAFFGEPRIVTLAAWVVVAIVFAARSESHSTVRRAGWLLTAHPAWALMLWAGWTEPLSIAIAVLTWSAWERTPGLRGSLLGALLASKQYFAPLGLWMLASRRLTRVAKLTGLAVAGVLVGISALWGVGEAWESLVAFHARQTPRPDGLTLYGLGAALGADVVLPTWLAPLAASVAALVGGRVRSGLPSPWPVFAATLAIFFVLGSQAFANYWFVVLGAAVLAVAADHGPPAKGKTGIEARAVQGDG